MCVCSCVKQTRVEVLTVPVALTGPSGAPERLEGFGGDAHLDESVSEIHHPGQRLYLVPLLTRHLISGPPDLCARSCTWPDFALEVGGIDGLGPNRMFATDKLVAHGFGVLTRRR